MPSFTRFEDIEAWQRARALYKWVHDLASEGDWARDYSLRDQIRRATGSIAMNIAEGFDRNSDVEFRRFLTLAKGSVAEVKTQLYLALDVGYLAEDAFKKTYEMADRIARMIGSLMSYLTTKISAAAEAKKRPHSPTPVRTGSTAL